ncbi:hypothetical protein LIER_28645 [Lithospermum erythrorhizon]|uniref:Uncharacterized protein n=1 Tax=Lithospermum erythrorhizon TaxID=34254 RepID=A0AAV3RHI5_LITER
MLEQQKMDEIIQLTQRNTEEVVAQNKRLDMQSEKLRDILTIQSHSEDELEEEVESIVDVKMNGGELIDDNKEPYNSPPPYVPPIPFPKRLERCKVIDDTPSDRSLAKGENEQQLPQIQDLESKQ